jgi:hypothetical protein
MGIPIQGQVGVQQLQDGAVQTLRQGRSAELISSQLHGRYFEQTLRGGLYSTGSGVTALSANTITLTSTTTPIVGVWNPSTSLVNLVILQASLTDRINNITSVDLGGFVWAASGGNGAITTGSAPFNRRTLVAAGSSAKAFPGGVALTGLTNSLVVFEGADFPVASGLLTTTVAVATPTPSVVGVQFFDGSLIVPPGGVLALLNTTSVTTHSVTSRLMWEEVPA